MSELEAAEVTVTAPIVSSNREDDLGAIENTPVKEPEPQKQDDGVELLKRQLSEKQREAEEFRRQKSQLEQICI